MLSSFPLGIHTGGVSNEEAVVHRAGPAGRDQHAPRGLWRRCTGARGCTAAPTAAPKAEPTQAPAPTEAPKVEPTKAEAAAPAADAASLTPESLKALKGKYKIVWWSWTPQKNDPIMDALKGINRMYPDLELEVERRNLDWANTRRWSRPAWLPATHRTS